MKRTRHGYLFATIAILGMGTCARAARAQDPQQNATTQRPAATPSAAPLTLDSFLKQVEGNYPKLLALEAERQSASAKRLEKQGAFDPVFTAGTLSAAFNDG